MRVLIVHNAGSEQLPSGETVVVERDLAALRSLGVEAEVELTRHDVSRASPLAAVRAAAGLFWSRAAYRRTQQRIRDFSPDVVHAHSVLPAISASVFHAAKELGIATVQTLHNYRWLCVEGGLLRDGEYCTSCVGSFGLRGVANRCAKGSRLVSLALAANNAVHVASGSLFRVVDRFVAVSEFVRQHYLRAGFPPDKLVVRRNSVEVLPARTNRDENTICFVGRLDRGKGADLLPALVRALPNYNFAIAGAGPLEATLREAFAADLSSRVRFRGYLPREEVAAELGRAAVVVVPSRAAETFGLVAAEAMAAGTPVVVSDRGALPELVRESGGGLVASPEVGALAGAIRQVVDSDPHSIGARGRAFAERELSPETAAARLLELYRQAGAGSR